MIKKYIKIILKTIIMILLTLFVLYNFMNINNKKQFIEIFGHKIMIVEEYQVQKGIQTNDIIIGKESKNGYNNNDLVIIRKNGAIYFHRVIEVRNGNEYITKGDGNYKTNEGTIKIDQIEGKVIKQIQNLGIILKIVRSKAFTVLIITISIMLFVYNNHIHKKRIKRQFKYMKKGK